MAQQVNLAKIYKCPEGIAQALAENPGLPLFAAILKLKPKRIRWTGQPPASPPAPKSGTTTCWSLDGKPTTYEEFREAAGLPFCNEVGRPAI